MPKKNSSEWIMNFSHEDSFGNHMRDFLFLAQFKPEPLSFDGPKSITVMSWGSRRMQRERVDFDTFSEEEKYTGRELEDYADALLRADAKENNPVNGENPILFEEHLYNRRRKEILVESGTPDDSLHIEQSHRPGVHRSTGTPMFNRTHPRGRKVNSKEQRTTNGASFYR